MLEHIKSDFRVSTDLVICFIIIAEMREKCLLFLEQCLIHYKLLIGIS